MVCDGTTLSTFIHDRIDFSLEDYFEAKGAFLDCYHLLKDFECFQHTRFTNPDVMYKERDNIPLCVEDAFNQYYNKGFTTFNKNRLKQIEKNWESDQDENNKIRERKY